MDAYAIRAATLDDLNALTDIYNHYITMGCGDECPFVPGAETDDWPIEDPKGKPVERVREIRDEPEIRPASSRSRPTSRMVVTNSG